MTEELNILGKTLKISASGGGANISNLEPITLELCNKIFGDLYNVLLQKGVSSDDISADNPTGLVDAVKALPTNTIGGVNKNFPLAFFPKNISGFGTDVLYHDIIDNRYFRAQSSSTAVYIHDMTDATWDEDNQSIDGGNVVFTIDKTALQNAISTSSPGVTLGNIKLRCVPDSFNIVYFSTSGHVGIITPDLETKGISATCVQLTAGEDSLVSDFASDNSGYSPYATNGEKMLMSSGSTSKNWNILVDLLTGEACAKYWSFIDSAYNKNAYVGYPSKKYKDLWLCDYSQNTTFMNIDWDNMDNTTASYTAYGAYVLRGYEPTEGKIYSFWNTSNSVKTLEIYDVQNKSAQRKTVNQGFTDMFLFLNNAPSQWNHQEVLLVEKRADGCIQILSPYGFLILDSSGNFVKPIEGASAYSIRAVNGVDFSENSSAVISLCLKWNGKYYLVFFENATFKNGLIGVYYDKIWVNFFLRNERPIYYASINTATKELLDGTLLNSDTVTISVDVSGNGGGE